MKVSIESYVALREAIRPLAGSLAEHRKAIIAEGKAKDVEKRLRWDALYAAKVDGRRASQWVCDALYSQGLNDSHVDTALRSVMRELGIGL